MQAHSNQVLIVPVFNGLQPTFSSFKIGCEMLAEDFTIF